MTHLFCQENNHEIDAAAMERGIGGDEALQILQSSLTAEAHQAWTAGRIPRLYEAPFLLAFLRELQESRGRVAQRLPLSSEEVPQDDVRMLRAEHRTSRSSHQHKLEGQPSGEHPDTLRVLSSILARHAHQAWSIAYTAYAELGFPLAHSAINRVMRLRGYGDGLCAPAAAEFIKAVMEAK